MTIRHVLAVLAALFLALPTHAEEEEHEGGIIGTGIVGTVTHLGSIYVNGQHIQIDQSQTVTGAIGSMTAASLQPGHIVAVTVRPDGADWRALDIRQILPLVGPLEEIGETTFTVLGTRVEFSALTPPPAVGDWVAVSGLWQGQVVKASRLDLLPKAYRQARISGTYFGPDTEGRNIIGTTAITGINATHLQPGNLVRVFGTPIEGGIEAIRLERHLFGDDVQLVQVEGHFSRPQPSGLYTVLGSGLIAYAERPDMINAESHVILCGTDGQLGVSKVSPGDAEELRFLSEQLDCFP